MNAYVTFRSGEKLSLLLLSMSLLSLMTGCSSISGIGGSSDYACPMPQGSTCKSMSQTYQDSYRSPGAPAGGSAQGQARTGNDVSASSSYEASNLSQDDAVISKPKQPTLPAEIGTPLLTGPRVMRIYIAPWTDADDNLLDGHRVFVKIEDSHWRLDHVKATLYRQYAPIIPMSKGATSPESTAPSSGKGTGAAGSTGSGNPFPPVTQTKPQTAEGFF
jgi:conjugal transfer pilus assembly protein TraV